MALIDVVIFTVLVIGVVGFGIVKGRHEGNAEDYFLAGRGLKWWLIGFSLIAANISAEQFVGMSGQAANDEIGLAVASYEWIAAITLIGVAFFFLPKFLRAGIYTIPEFLEYRFTHSARGLMSLLTVATLVCVNITAVIFMGAKALEPLFEGSQVFGRPLDITVLAWIVGVAAAVYVAVGGLKACAWTDLFWGTGLIAGGAIILGLALYALDQPDRLEGLDNATITQSIGVAEDATLGEKLAALKQKKMHMVLPADNPAIPWTALVLGIWIPNFFYWGLNQYIMQRTLGAHSLADGQRGVVFAAALKLIIPFVVCIPGIIGFALYQGSLQQGASTKTNAETLDTFEQVKDNPKTAGKLFKFNGDFAKLYPQQAEEILTFNAAVLDAKRAAEGGLHIAIKGGIAHVVVGAEPAPTKGGLAKRNAELLKGVKADAGLKVQTELVGYDYDSTFPTLVKRLAPDGLTGFLLAALMGAVVSSLAAMLNAASTIFTMDLYREYLNKGASQRMLVLVGRLSVPIAVVVGCVIAPRLARPEYQGAFHFIQEFQGYLSPGVLTVFLFGLFVPLAPRMCGAVGLVLSPAIYGALHWWFGADMAFLNRMAITVAVISLVLLLMTLIKPLKEPVKLPEQTRIEMTGSRGAVWAGLAVIAATVALYVIFW